MQQNIGASRTDPARNVVDFFDLAEPHTSLVIEGVSTVTTGPQTFDPGTVRFPRRQLDECGRMERCVEFLHASGLVAQECH